jgi:putative ATP-binding cassette transporter
MTLNAEPVYMQEHRYLFAAIFNDFHLFDRLYGIETVDDRQVNALLLQMELLHKTQWTQGRFSTLALSAGQKRRLAMIVALMENKPICIFDEWAADQAPHFRRHFYEELLPALKRQGKTVIAVTHDDHYYHVADRVIKMEYGNIIAE